MQLAADFWCCFKQSINKNLGYSWPHYCVSLDTFVLERRKATFQETVCDRNQAVGLHNHIIATDMWSSSQMCWIHCTIFTLLRLACSYLSSNRGMQSCIQGFRKRTVCTQYQFRIWLVPKSLKVRLTLHNHIKYQVTMLYTFLWKWLRHHESYSLF